MRLLPVLLILCLLAPPPALAQSKIPGVDEECEGQFRGANRQCSEESAAGLKACMQKRLSASCAKQVTAPPNVPRSQECRAEAGAVSETCAKTMMEGSGQCVRSKLTATCQAQLVRFLGPAPVK